MSAHLHPLTVSEIRAVGDRSLAIRFDTKNCDPRFLQYHAGQYLSLEADIEAQTVRRAYSISSSPHSRYLEIGVRILEDGLFSGWAARRLKVGDTLRAQLPNGNFSLPENLTEQQNLLFIACGSGITPILSMIEELLHANPKARATLLYGNSTINTMMYREELLFLKNKYPSRLQTFYFYSRQDQEIELFHGRINQSKLTELLRKGLFQPRDFNHCYLCGPQQVIKEGEEFLLENGLEKERVHHELFLSNQGDLQSKGATKVKAESSVAAKARIKLDGRWYPVDLQQEGDILNQALEQNVDLPYSCLAGVCSSCRARLTKGKVRMDAHDALTEDEIERGYILTCQSHALTNEVEIDFDQ